jgi:hypothetical protein
MDKKFCDAYLAARQTAENLGVRLRPVDGDVMAFAHRCLSGHRESDGFAALAKMGRLDLTLEALAVKKQFTALFSDEEANNALMRLLDAGYGF